MRLSRIFTGILVILFLFVAACAPAPTGGAQPSAIEVTDQTGGVVRLEKLPERIISLSPANTEILFALGLADRIVGVTDYCDYPSEAKKKTSIGGFSTPDIEKIISLTPDLVVATTIHKDKIVPQLRQRGLPVFTLDPVTVEEVLESIALVGAVTGQGGEASRLVSDLKQRIGKVTSQTGGLPAEKLPRTLFLVWHGPLVTGGRGTFSDDLISRAGGRNIASGLTGWTNVSLEKVVEASPEVMIASGGHGEGGSLSLKFLQTEPRLKDTEARRRGRVYAIDGDLMSRPAPRLVDGLEQLARFIHPELFGEAGR
ncbi:MAG: cobalamin-binding protein [Chloroflexota bacterium]